MIISAIAAISSNRGLGYKNDLLFKIPADMKRMRSLTMGHPIIMGRKTHESIGRPRPKRTNIIVTRDKVYTAEGCLVVHSVEEAIELAKQHDANEIFIFGGGEIYKQAMPYVSRLYLTVVDGEFPADTFFPDYSSFTNIISEEKYQEEDYTYTFLTLERDN